jgi:hypothetical protein
LLHGPGIRAADMLHLVVEVFGERDLEPAVLRQRLLVANAAELLGERLGEHATGRRRFKVRRAGDDLYVNGRKLSVSVAALTPVSSVVHLGVNVTTAGTPRGVATIGLAQLGVETESWARALLKRFTTELDSVHQASCLVRGKP